MKQGRFIAVVGPSGVGKDSLITAISRQAPHIVAVQRTITRPSGSGGEAHKGMSEIAFADALRSGAFCLHWRAHGLRYGLPSALLDDISRGENRIANLSRTVLGQALELFPDMLCLNVTASPETLARRLAGRGRETAADIAQRLARPAPKFPQGLSHITLHNDGALEETVAQAMTSIERMSPRVSLNQITCEVSE